MEVIGSNTNMGEPLTTLLSPKKSTADDQQPGLDDSSAEHRETISQLSPASGFQNDDGEKILKNYEKHKFHEVSMCCFCT
jgi:hypothetical protein